MKRLSLANSAAVRRIIELALEEDLAQGDVTSELCVLPTAQGHATVLAREKLRWCGSELVSEIVRISGRALHVESLVTEGEEVDDRTALLKLSGSLRDLLALERTILNFVQRLSGVATYTASVVQHAQGITVLDTRKTVPGWRALDKYAVRVGGGSNHRWSLGDMVLVKNNHIDACGGDVAETLRRVNDGKPPYMSVEVEVRNLAELRAAAPFKPSIVMLDNFGNDEIGAALEFLRSSGWSPLVEVSGGVTAQRLVELKTLGVRFVSMGALTTQARQVDISMRVELDS